MPCRHAAMPPYLSRSPTAGTPAASTAGAFCGHSKPPSVQRMTPPQRNRKQLLRQHDNNNYRLFPPLESHHRESRLNLRLDFAI